MSDTLKELETLNMHLIDVRAQIDMLKEELDDTKSYSLNLRKARVMRESAEELDALYNDLQKAREILAHQCAKEADLSESPQASAHSTHFKNSDKTQLLRECKCECKCECECECEIYTRKRKIKPLFRQKFAYKAKKSDKFREISFFQKLSRYSEKRNNNFERYNMKKTYINHLCIITLAGTVFACGGGSGSPSAGGGATAALTSSSGSSSGSGGNTIGGVTSSSSSTSSGGNDNKKTGTGDGNTGTGDGNTGTGDGNTGTGDGNNNIPTTFAVRGFDLSGKPSIDITVPNDAWGRAYNRLHNGIDLNKFLDDPTSTQLSGTAQLKGYLHLSGAIPEIDEGQTIRGASTLNFDFAKQDNHITGTASNFGLYSVIDNSGADSCTASTCSFTKLRDIASSHGGGEDGLKITGSRTVAGSNKLMTLTLNGTLTNQLEMGKITYQFGAEGTKTNIPGGISGSQSLYGNASGSAQIIAQTDFGDTAQRSHTITVNGAWRE